MEAAARGDARAVPLLPLPVAGDAVVTAGLAFAAGACAGAAVDGAVDEAVPETAEDSAAATEAAELAEGVDEEPASVDEAWAFETAAHAAANSNAA